MFGDSKFRLTSLFIAIITINIPGLKADTQITIDASKKYQTIEGFGFMLASGVHSQTKTENLNANLFDKFINDLGMSIVRLPFPAGFEKENDNDDPYTFDWSKFDPERVFRSGDKRGGDCFRRDADAIGGEYNFDLNMAKGFAQKGARFFVSPWIVPDWLWNHPRREEEFAEMMSAFVQYMKNEGINVEWVSILNEPDMGVCMHAGNDEIKRLVQALRFRFQRDGLSTKIIAPECGAWNADGRSPQRIGNPDVYAFHYGQGRPDELEHIRDKVVNDPNIQIWNTEWAAPAWDGLEGGPAGHKAAMILGEYLHNMLVHGGISAPVFFHGYWTTKVADCKGYCLVRISHWTSPSITEYARTYYSFKQFSRYIKPGSRRIDVRGGDPQLKVSAYLHQDGTFTIVAINSADRAKEVVFNLNGIGVSLLNRFRYSENENCKDIGSISVSDGWFSDILKSQSITTYTIQTFNTPPQQDTISPAPPRGVKVKQE